MHHVVSLLLFVMLVIPVYPLLLLVHKNLFIQACHVMTYEVRTLPKKLTINEDAETNLRNGLKLQEASDYH